MKRKSIKEWLECYSGETIDLCYEIVTELESQSLEEQVVSLRDFCEMFGNVESSRTEMVPVHIGMERYGTLANLYGSYVNVLIKTALNKAYQQQMDKMEFYHMLWDSVVNADIISGQDETTFALYCIVIDRRLPYYQLDHGIVMEDSKFKELQIDNFDSIKKLRFILLHDFSQRTEQTSLVLKELEKIEDFEARSVVLANVFAIMEDLVEKAVEARAKREANKNNA